MLGGEVLGVQAQLLDHLGVELWLDRAEGDVLPVGALVHVVEVGPGVQHVLASVWRGEPGVEHPVEEGHEAGRPVDHCRVHHLAHAGALGRQQGADDAVGQVHATAAHVADQVQWGDGTGVMTPHVGQHAGQGDVVDVVPGRRGVRAVLTPAGHPPVHKGRVPGQAVVGSDAESLGHPGSEPLEHHVGPLHQAEHHLAARVGFEVHADASTAATVDEGGRTVGITAADRGRPVDSDDVGPHVSQHHPAEWAGPYPGQLDYSDAVECSHGDVSSVGSLVVVRWCRRPGGSGSRWRRSGTARLRGPGRGPSRRPAQGRPRG